MAFVVGIALAIGVALMGRFVGFDRDRAFYSAVLMVVASYYVLFGVMSGSTHVVLMESAVTAVFVGAAIGGFRSSGWIVVAGLAGHGVFDVFHGRILENAGVPVWWPQFCLAYDIVAAACLAWIITRGAASDAASVHAG